MFGAPAFAAHRRAGVLSARQGFQVSLESGEATYGASPGVRRAPQLPRGAGDLDRCRRHRSTPLIYVALAVIARAGAWADLAVTLNRLFRGRGIVIAILILPWALPSVVSGVLWRRVFDPDSGLLNSVLLQLH